ncbi:MAG: glutamate racemase [Bacteroidia bacterium]
MRRIGLFDSGLGGLITARWVWMRRPSVDLLYYGDTAHLPYGDKSPAQLRGYVREIVRFLIAAGAEGIGIACNTASAVAVDVAQEVAAGLPVWDAIQPTLAYFRAHRLPEPVGVIGTYTTIRSHLYGRALSQMGYTVKELATPLLVPLIEEGWIKHPATRAALRTYLTELGEVRTLVLACTHYPLLVPLIRRYYLARGQVVKIISTARLLAEAIYSTLAESEQKGSLTLWLSDPNPRFVALASRFWGKPLRPMPLPCPS